MGTTSRLVMTDKYDLGKVRDKVIAALEDMYKDPSMYEDMDSTEDDEKPALLYYLESLANGSDGIYRPTTIIETFSLGNYFHEYIEAGDPHDGILYKTEVWDELEGIFHRTGRDMTQKLGLEEAQIWFNHWEADGSFSMFLWVKNKNWIPVNLKRLTAYTLTDLEKDLLRVKDQFDPLMKEIQTKVNLCVKDASFMAVPDHHIPDQIHALIASLALSGAFIRDKLTRTLDNRTHSYTYKVNKFLFKP